MSRTTDLSRARAILGADVLGPEELERAFGRSGTHTGDTSSVPFREERLAAATGREMLVWRAANAGGEPLTLLNLIQRFPDAFDERYLKSMGYQLKSEWGIELEPLAAVETCRPGWALVHKAVLGSTCNLSFEEQKDHLAAWAADHSPGLPVRRRSAVEIVFDLIVAAKAQGRRLLGDAWEWSGSQTIDGGYLNVGHFDERGVQIFSFSPGVRHGKLGICPNVDGEL
jgi:hypothetical protein